MKNKTEITINGKAYPAKVGMAFLELATKSENLSITDFFNKIQTDGFFLLPRLVMYSIQSAGGNISIEEVYDWLDEEGISNPQMEAFSALIVDSLSVHAPKSTEGNVGKQKK